MSELPAFRAARDFLLRERTDHSAARAGFAWPALDRFNWALDHFDQLAVETPDRPALITLTESPTGLERQQRSFLELAQSSDRMGALFESAGVARGDRVLLMLPNAVELWEAMLAAMKIGAVIIPATLQLTAEDIADRLVRGKARHVVVDASCHDKFPPGIVGGSQLVNRFTTAPRAPIGWRSLRDADRFELNDKSHWQKGTRASDPMLLYFTSGTTAQPKLVLHTHASYPVGHLSTMFWIGLRPGDLHWNISSPGWAKHAWSNVFAPWNAGATVLAHASARFKARDVLDILVRERVTTLCAPPTVWRMLILEDLASFRVELRDAVAAGEPLNPEIIARVESAWKLTVRDGFGQTETTALVGNAPGSRVKPGSMGQPLPGYEVLLLDAEGKDAAEGELCIGLSPRPTGLMVGYEDDAELTSDVMRGGVYHTGDVARRDEDGYITYVGRADDVFKASDYRISPFELESVLLEHPAIAEAAVVPSPDPIRLAIPKAFVLLTPGSEPSATLAGDVLAFVRSRVAPYKRIRRLEFITTMPKTISGKIRRVELRTLEQSRGENRLPVEGEHFDA